MIRRATKTDENRITEQVADAAGRLSKLIARDSQAGDQVTYYFYKSALSGSFQTDVVYPDAVSSDVTGNPSDLNPNGTDHVHSVFDRLGRVTSRTDQRGVMHEYVFNSSGQLSADKVTTLPGGVDGTIRRIERGYDDRGRGTSWTSYDAASGGNVVNQTTHTYSDSAGTWNSLSKIQQNHTGSVDSNSPAIEYGIADGATSGVAQYLRRTSVTYPGKAGSRRVVYNNHASSGVGAMVNRLDNLADDSSGTTKYAQYSYFGGGSIYKVDHPAVSGGLTLNYDINADHAYAAFNRLGQVIDHKWTSGDGSSVIDRHTYGYDKAGNRTYKRNEVAATTTQPFDELYGHDNLDRLKTADRGILNGNRDALTGGTKSFAQAWVLDKLGNWTAFKHDNTGAGWTFEQARTHNLANEIDTDNDHTNGPGSSITQTAGSGGDWVDPKNDAAGNMTQFPKAGAETTRLHAVYDAWNRLMEVHADSGGSSGTVIVTYRYDGLNHRIRKLVEGGDTFDIYHNEAWQVLEVRKNADTDPLEQYIWDQRYIDAPALLFRDSDVDGTVNDTLYVTQDANFNVTALVNVYCLSRNWRTGPSALHLWIVPNGATSDAERSTPFYRGPEAGHSPGAPDRETPDLRRLPEA